MAVLAGGASFTTAACGPSEQTGGTVAVASSSADPGRTPPPTGPTTATPNTPTKTPGKTPGKSPTPKRTSGGGGTGSMPPSCKLGDLTFRLSIGTGGGTGIPGSLIMTNGSNRKCRLSGYLLLTWRDANGSVIPVSVTRRPDPQTPHAILIAPGARGIVGLGWQRYKTNPPVVTCTPVPKTLDIRLPPTLENPHPENGAAKRISWFSGESAGMCGPKVDMLPVDVMY